MAFAPPFQRVFPATFDRRAAGASWWLSGGISAANAIAVYQPKGAASLAASYVNLVNPGTYDAAPGVAPGWSAATGWSFDGSTQYLKTSVIPEADWTTIIRFAGFADDGVLIGCRDWAAGQRYYIEVASWGGRFFNGATTTLWDNAYTVAVKALAGRTAYTNGSAVGTSPDTDAAPDYQLYIGARNNKDSTDEAAGAQVLAVAVYASTLSAAQVASISAAMAAL